MVNGEDIEHGAMVTLANPYSYAYGRIPHAEWPWGINAASSLCGCIPHGVIE